MPIPKILHFIWVGARPVSDAGLGNIKKWMTINPEFQVFLWVDRVATPPEVLENYVLQPKYFHTEIAAERLVLMDITEHNMVSPEARYEIDRLRPNYGAASDSLRYRILHRYGGAYYDCDIVPTIGYHSVVWLAENESLSQREVGTLYLEEKEVGIAVYALNPAYDYILLQQPRVDEILARKPVGAVIRDKGVVEEIVSLCGYTQSQVNLSTVDYLWGG